MARDGADARITLRERRCGPVCCDAATAYCCWFGGMDVWESGEGWSVRCCGGAPSGDADAMAVNGPQVRYAFEMVVVSGRKVSKGPKEKGARVEPCGTLAEKQQC